MNSYARQYIEKNFQPWRLRPSPREFLTDDDIKSIIQDLPQGYQDDFENLKNAFKYHSETVLENGLMVIWKTIEDRLKNNPKGSYIRDFVGFGGCHFGDINAFAFPCHDNLHGVCVDLQLSAYLLYLTITICSVFKIGPYTTPLLSPEQFAQEIGLQTLYFLNEVSIEQMQESFVDTKTLTPTKEHSEFCMQGMRGQVTFVLLHEIGHILSGHTEELRPISEYSKYICRRVRNSNEDHLVYSRTQIDEFEADEKAVDLMLEIADGNHEIVLGMHSGANMLFSILNYFERVLNVLYGSGSPTHPPAEERRLRVNRKFESEWEIDQENINFMDLLFNVFDACGREAKSA